MHIVREPKTVLRTVPVNSAPPMASGGKKHRQWLRFKRNRTLLLMSLPAILFFFVFCYIPMPGIYIAFVNYNYISGIFHSTFIGMKNFEFFLQSGDLWRITWNTIYYNLLFLVTSTIAQVAVAVMLNEIVNKPFKKVSQTLILLPYFISWVLVGLFLYGFINADEGVINVTLRHFGMHSIDFYSQKAYWPFILTFLNLWKGVGYGSIIYLSVITGIDSQIIEAAMIDGASTWQRIRYITLPALEGTVVILTLFAVGGILKGNFQMFYSTVGANNTVLMPSTDIIETYVFRCLSTNFNFSLGSAAGAYQSVLGFLIVMFANGVVKRIEPDYALF